MLFKIKQTIKNNLNNEKPLFLLAVLCFLYSLYIAFRYAHQVPLDNYSFRQTQTALTAYWLLKNGFSLAYETPVAGQPWSIPFEFPIYQYIVALITKLSGLSLNAVGRLVSYLFLVLCLIPTKSITRNLNFPKSVFYIFTALLFSSPIYLYWGRTFMIETAALFFTIVAIKFFVDIIQNKNSSTNQFFFLLFMTLSLLQKATTGLPVLAILCFLYVFLNIRNAQSLKNFIFSKGILSTLIYFGIPLAISIFWTMYTDHIKTLNGLGTNLTSNALISWNWGTLHQRLSFALYRDIIWTRIFERNLSGMLGIAILIVSLCTNAKNQIKIIMLISISLGFIPLFLFTNLHIVHDYYQVANVIFLIYAIAIALGSALHNYSCVKPIIVLTLIMVTSNYFCFYKNYLGAIKAVFNKENSRDFAVSDKLKKEIAPEKHFIAFGNDWSSSFAYLSERKSFTVPMFFKQYQNISLNPDHFIEETLLGAVVLCPPLESPTLIDLSEWTSTNRNWKIGEVFGCYIATPEIALKTPKPTSNTSCEGNIDFAGEVQVNKVKMLSFSGWTTLSKENDRAPEKVYITLTKKDSPPIYFEALQVNHVDVNAPLQNPNHFDNGFSRIISPSSLSGTYMVGIARLNMGHLETCQFQKELVINA